MHCPHCRHPMSLTEEVVESHTRQRWYECEACGTLHTVSEPATGQRYRFAQGYSATATAQTMRTR